MERYRQPDNDAVPDVSDMLETIPGIGIIRLRALKKAGWHSISALRKASLKDLMTVPGISSVKAQQILDYVCSLSTGSPAMESQQAQPTANSQPSPPAPVFGSESVSATEKSANPPAEPEERKPTTVEAVQAILQRIARSASLLLSHEPVNDPDGKLAKQLSRWVAVCEGIQGAADLSEKKAKRALASLERVSVLLEKATARESLGNRRISQLTEDLREQRRELKKIGLA